MAKEYYHSLDTHQFGFRANPALTETIKNLATVRHRSMSNTIRTLIYMGLEQYKTNELKGIRTSERNREAVAVNRAKGEADAMEKAFAKERKGKGKKPLPALTAMLVDSIPPDD